MRKRALLLIAGLGLLPMHSASARVLSQFENFTLLNAKAYRQTVNYARHRAETILLALKPFRKKEADQQIAFIAAQLADIPYMRVGAMGEGDWQPKALTYHPGALHIKQNPVYRFDGLDCQTFVQIAMALYYSQNRDQFDQNILRIAYGAAGNPRGEIVRYYNRNNFVDGDFNPVNERQGFLQDVTGQNDLAPYVKTTTAHITRQKWFLYQQQNIPVHVRVLAYADGNAMVKRFRSVYANLPFPRFNSELVSTTYIPKQSLALKQRDGRYLPNQALLDRIPTPAIVEIVRNAKEWSQDGIRVKSMLGTESSISHFGLLYRKTFQQGDLIYRKITCNHYWNSPKTCRVTAIQCEQKQCQELMFAHATDALPEGYYYYQRSDGNYVCTAYPPSHGETYSRCNRVVQVPLFNYLTDYQFGTYWYMNMPSMLGIHIEKLR